MGLPVEKAEIDRVLAVPLDMLCSPRYARVDDSFSPTDNGAAAEQDGDEAWSGFTCESLSSGVGHARIGLCLHLTCVHWG